MRSLLGAIIPQLLFAGIACAQPVSSPATELAGTILIEVSASLDSALGQAFIVTRPAGDPQFSHSDINRAVLSSGTEITGLFQTFYGLHGLRLRPYIPTHSVAFQDIREWSNPQLFGKGESTSSQHDVSELRLAESKISHWFVLSFSDSISDEAAAAIARKSPLIERAEPKNISYPCYTPNDPDILQQYALSLMDCYHAWDVVRCDSTMIIADVDLGTDWSHEDLAADIYLNPGEIGIDSNGLDKRSNGVDDDHNGFIDDWHGWDFAGPADSTSDNDARPGPGQPNGGHGTHTAGIMAAVGNNGIGIAGVAFGARLIPIKVACDVCGTLDFGFEGIVYAADMHAKVVNCSWGDATYSQAEQDVVNYAYAKDCAVVAAAGNNYMYQAYYPASYQHVLSVAAVDASGNVASLSNYNPYVDVVAPGIGVLSTVPGNQYETMDGTSMASPNAAGVVALVRQRFPNFTAGQAMEQVRVTGNPIGGLDSSRFDYEGHGIVDAYRAVTDTDTHSARIESYAIDDPLKTGSLAPGESGDIVLTVRNYLQPVQHLEGRLEVVQGADYVTLGQTLVSFGPAGTLQVVTNDSTAFRLRIADSVPPNTQILVRVFFSDSSVGYYEDYDYFRFTVNPSYLDLNKNNLTVTFSSTGNLGYNDALINSEGSGFLWRNPPPFISPEGLSLLYQGGLMAGIDSNHVVDVIEGLNPNAPDYDFTPEENVHYITPPDHSSAAQELECEYTDSLADPSVQIGLRTRCRAYAFNQGLAANAIVIDYVFYHLNNSLGTYPLASDSTEAGIYTDWDIGPSGNLNVTRFDTSTQTAISYRLEQNFPYVGVKLLSPLPPGAALNYHAIMNNGSQGDINTYAGLSKQDKWRMLTEFYKTTGPGDISHSFGLKNMPLRSQDSVEMILVIALAQDQATLDQTIDQTAALWAQKSGVHAMPPAAQSMLEVYPNPFQHTLHISWDQGGPALITIFDEIGRVVESRIVSSSFYNFTPTLPSGVYTVDVLVGGIHLRRQVMATQ